MESEGTIHLKRLKRIAWVATLLTIPLLFCDVLLSPKLGNGLAMRVIDGHPSPCITVRVDPATGRTVEVPKLYEIAFVVILFAAVVPPPILWVSVLLWWLVPKKQSSRMVINS